MAQSPNTRRNPYHGRKTMGGSSLNIHGWTTPQLIPKDLRTRPAKDLPTVEGGHSKTTTTIRPCKSPNGCPQQQQFKTEDWRMGPKRTAISPRRHGYICWQNQKKTRGVGRHQLPNAPIHTTRRVYTTRKRRGTPASRHKGSGVLYMP